MKSMPPNVRLFLLFRVLFNARFYYPVLAIMFVDLGLTLDQYALLNVAWAASIVAFELPLGAVSDRLGRRPLVVGAAALMVVEMAVLAFVPTGNATLLFVVFLVNRVLSGLAEAAASGADEALAYDTMMEDDRQREWPQVLTYLQRLSAAGFILTTLIGAAVYDADLLNRVAGALGLDLGLTASDTVRFPVYLTLLMAIGAFLVTLRMREPGVVRESATPPNLRESLATIRDAWGFIRGTHFVFAIILFALVTDSVVRLFLTLQSSYFRMIGIPEALFGIFGAAFAGLGFLSPAIARRLLVRFPPAANFGVIAAVVMLGLVGVALSGNFVGAFFVVPLAIGWHLLSFFSSQYLNEATDSSRRATVLSFKSLAGNLAYGVVGVLYALLYRLAGDGGTTGTAGEDAVLAQTLVWLPILLPIALLPLFAWARLIPRMARRG